MEYVMLKFCMELSISIYRIYGNFNILNLIIKPWVLYHILSRHLKLLKVNGKKFNMTKSINMKFGANKMYYKFSLIYLFISCSKSIVDPNLYHICIYYYKILIRPFVSYGGECWVMITRWWQQDNLQKAWQVWEKGATRYFRWSFWERSVVK